MLCAGRAGAVARPRDTRPMPCSVLVAAADSSTGRPPLLSHSFDTPGGVDFRLVSIPAHPRQLSAESGCRPIFRYEEESLPRFRGSFRGNIPAYATELPDDTATYTVEQIGELPTHDGETLDYVEAASGIANSAGLMLAECTCSAVFGALPRGKAGGKALLGYMELTRLALERCVTAREAILLMGGLAVEHGFYGNTTDLGGSAESLCIIDSAEAWVFHILADDSGASAIWAAQRLDPGHAAACCNMFIIRAMEPEDSDRFLLSDSALEVASRLGLWDPCSGAPFDFAACYSAGEARHRHYSGRRHWRALSLLAPSLGLSPHYEDLLLGAPAYPFSVMLDRPIDRTDFFAIMRDTYTGTEYDLATQPAAGPFGMTDRYDGGLSSSALDGHFERPIGVYRMAYSYVGEAMKGRPIVFWGPHAAQTGMYFPIILTSVGGCIPVPPALGTGSIKRIDRGCAYWAFRRVKQSAMICWDRSLEHIVARQHAWETKGLAIVDADESSSTETKLKQLAELAAAAVADWWMLDDELTLRFGDGWEHEWVVAGVVDSGASRCRPLVYPDSWLERVGFASNAPPKATLWTVDRKLHEIKQNKKGPSQVDETL